MNLLFSINDRFYQQLMTVLYSIYLNSHYPDVNVYVIVNTDFHYAKELQQACQRLGMDFHLVKVPEDDFADAPVTDRYPKTIYNRLLAHLYLPKSVHRILYLDADLLCINDLTPLYNVDLSGYMYASAIHTNLTNATDVINKIRLQNFDADGYYNSGVLLMNLAEIRQRVHPQDISHYIRQHVLLLPDQDVLNALYGRYIRSVPDELYNFDARNLRIYETISMGKCTLDWVMNHTVLLHYCGRQKPWLTSTNHGKFTALYKNYFRMTQKLFQN